MSSKVLLLSALYILHSCWGDERRRTLKSNAMQQLDTSSDDLDRSASLWRQSWRPWRIFQWGRHSMFNNPLTHSSKFWESDNGRHHIHHDRVVTRRESSLIRAQDGDLVNTARTQSTAKLVSESTISFATQPRAKGSIRKELIGMMFESMLNTIVESWEVIAPPVKAEESANVALDLGKSPSELTFTSKKTKKAAKDSSSAAASVKNPKIKKSRSSKLGLSEIQAAIMTQCWWSSPDERATIRFRNGNIYEGSISMKCMHGEGRFQWSDGTMYLGQFKNNEINGKGIIHWKDDTWYEGDFCGNLRHGRGLYVNSRKQTSYVGGWHCGAKHGQGVIHYSSFDTNSYDGEWILNVRHGFGSREYTAQSGYRGEWDRYVREGKGLMLWPNHDFYRGGWKNGVMSGFGIYIWDAHYNNSMSLPSLSAYRGHWERGERNGYGVLNLGLGLGSHYKGEFKNNKKHGAGKFVSNNGLIMQHKQLFNDDNMVAAGSENSGTPEDSKRAMPVEPYEFNICDDTIGLNYHIQQAFKNMDKREEIRANMIHDYMENNKLVELKSTVVLKADGFEVTKNTFHLDDMLQFEDISVRKSLRCYETELKSIYYKYATICNAKEINFSPVLLRLYLWQFYNDCRVHEKGLNLVEIDRIFHQNPEWLSRNPHDPFEKIYFWQFVHSLISVANRLYAKKQLPSVKPDTILASAFRNFMEKDALPGAGLRIGILANGYGSIAPLKGTYDLYRSIGEPHTVRKFLCAVRHPPHYQSPRQPALVSAPDDETLIGRNAFVIGDEMTFVTDEPVPPQNVDEALIDSRLNLKLFNFGNLSSKTIIKVFSKIFPQLCSDTKVIDLNIEITFYEFFEAFIACAQESIRIKDEELRWREKLHSNEGLPNPPHPSTATTLKSQKVK